MTEQDRGTTTSPKQQDSWGKFLFGHVFGILFCVLLPGFVTAIAPVSWVKFQRNGEKITARADLCTLFFISYYGKTIDPVVGIDDRFIAGKVTPRNRIRNRDHSVQSEDEAFLVVNGENEDSISVPVSPASIQQVLARVDNFLEDDQARQLSLFVVANWKFSVLGGGLVSLLTVLYGIGIVMGVFQWLRRLATRFQPVSR